MSEPGGEQDARPKRPTSRRDFFRAAGFGVAGLAAGGAVAGGIAAATASNPQEDYGFTPLPKRSEPGFDHVVVVMFENRSFDHMLGWLYPAGGEPAGQTFDGLAQGDY
ncbi:alkaline phosphatase family protein, partial [Plantibacter cousiniae (nom. nud.)]|uniref:alkaline phosphatase family protein n=1 Tax=Plantibacter cousiniae (nom. nud.) TaxID=199709 RepID=UPI0025B672BE